MVTGNPQLMGTRQPVAGTSGPWMGASEPAAGTAGPGGNIGIRSEPRSPTRIGGETPLILSARKRNRKSGLPVKALSEVQKIRIEN
jgi:hypothetical protein